MSLTVLACAHAPPTAASRPASVLPGQPIAESRTEARALADRMQAERETREHEKTLRALRGVFQTEWARDFGKPCNDNAECKAFCEPAPLIDTGGGAVGRCSMTNDRHCGVKMVEHGKVGTFRICFDPG